MCTPVILLCLVLLYSVLDNTHKVHIIPYPNNVEIRTGHFMLSPSSKIFYTKGCKKEATFLKHILQSEHQLHVLMAEHKTGVTTGNVYLSIIGKYLSSLRKLDHIIAPKEGFEAQL